MLLIKREINILNQEVKTQQQTKAADRGRDMPFVD